MKHETERTIESAQAGKSAPTPGSGCLVSDRITEYLANGGLYNPELMNHDKVRVLLMDARRAIDGMDDALKRTSDRSEPRSIALLRECLADAEANRMRLESPENAVRWKYFIEGIECAIHKLEMREGELCT